MDWCGGYDVDDMLMQMNTYLSVLAKDFAPDASVRRKKYHVFRFVVASVLQQEKILLDSLFIHI